MNHAAMELTVRIGKHIKKLIDATLKKKNVQDAMEINKKVNQF